MTPEANMQQSSGIGLNTLTQSTIEQSKNRGLTREKISRIMKFEKVIQKFCDQIGIDKHAFLHILQPEKANKDQVLA